MAVFVCGKAPLYTGVLVSICSATGRNISGLGHNGTTKRPLPGAHKRDNMLL